MRITGQRMIDLATASTAHAQESVADQAAQVSSGLRVARPSDDPAAWVAAERAKVRRSLSEGIDTAVETGRERLTQTDAALSTVGEAVAQIRVLAIEGANGNYTAADRIELGTQVRALFEGALGAAVTRGSNGEYLLGGSASSVAPYDAAGVYLGDSLVNSVPSGENASAIATIPGTRLTAAYGVDVLPLLKGVADSLSTNNMATLATQLIDLETAVRQISTTRTAGGGALSVLNATVAARDQLQANLSNEISRNVEIDTVSAASELAKASQSLEASRTVTSHLVALLDPRSA